MSNAIDMAPVLHLHSNPLLHALLQPSTLISVDINTNLFLLPDPSIRQTLLQSPLHSSTSVPPSQLMLINVPHLHEYQVSNREPENLCTCQV